jgi:hypothetical protein
LKRRRECCCGTAKSANRLDAANDNGCRGHDDDDDTAGYVYTKCEYVRKSLVAIITTIIAKWYELYSILAFDKVVDCTAHRDARVAHELDVALVHRAN